MNQRLVEAGEAAVPVKTLIEDLADGAFDLKSEYLLKRH